MPGPARAGAVLFAMDAPRLASFYEHVLAMKRLHDTQGLIVIESPDFQLVLHAIPPEIAADITIETPPALREDVAMKLFFTVDSLADAAARAAELSGGVFGEEWQGPGFRVRDAFDPEGNVFQVRELT